MSGNFAFANKGGAKWWRVWKRGAESGLGVRFWQHEGRHVLEGLEKRRRIRPGSKVLATRGAPSAGGFGKEAQNQARE